MNESPFVSGVVFDMIQKKYVPRKISPLRDTYQRK